MFTQTLPVAVAPHARYSIHFHMHGDTAYQSYLKNCSIHHTFSRALAVHGTNRLLIQHNTGYHTMGHTFFIEDGAEVMSCVLLYSVALLLW